MNADIITDPTFPHGDKYGYILGCHGSACPAKVKCIDVHTRYAGDFAFRKAIDAGETATDIVTREQKQAQEAADAALRAKQAERAQRSAKTREAARERHNAARRAKRAANLIPQKALIPRDTLRELLDQDETTDENLWDFASDLLDAWNIEDTNAPSLSEEFRDRFVARFRRSEVPEPTAESWRCGKCGDTAHAHSLTTSTCIWEPIETRPEPQGEPSDAQVAAAGRELFNRSRPGNEHADMTYAEVRGEYEADARAALRAAGVGGESRG